MLLSNVDESVFNNVFAVGLREIRETGYLERHRGRRTALQSHCRIGSRVAGRGPTGTGDFAEPHPRRRRRAVPSGPVACRAGETPPEIEELGSINHRYSRLAAERDQLQSDIVRLEEDSNRADHLARIADLAIALRDRSAQRTALDEQLSAIGPVKPMPEGAIERLDDVNARIEKHQQHARHHAEQRDALKREFAGLKVNDALWRQAVRIEAIQEQAPWIAQLQAQIGELEKEIGGLNSELADEGRRLGFESAPGDLPVLSSKKLKSLRCPGKMLHQNRQRLKEAQQDATEANHAVQSLTKQIESALTARGEKDLAAAMERGGNLVSQLRRCTQLDDRLEQLGRHQIELEEESRHLASRQLLPAGVLIGLGAVFVVGVVLVLAGLFFPTSVTGTVGWALALLGLASSGVAGLGKVMLERSNVQKLRACRTHLDVLQSQLRRAKPIGTCSTPNCRAAEGRSRFGFRRRKKIWRRSKKSLGWTRTAFPPGKRLTQPSGISKRPEIRTDPAGESGRSNVLGGSAEVDRSETSAAACPTRRSNRRNPAPLGPAAGRASAAAKRTGDDLGPNRPACGRCGNDVRFDQSTICWGDVRWGGSATATPGRQCNCHPNNVCHSNH